MNLRWRLTLLYTALLLLALLGVGTLALLTMRQNLLRSVDAELSRVSEQVRSLNPGLLGRALPGGNPSLDAVLPDNFSLQEVGPLYPEYAMQLDWFPGLSLEQLQGLPAAELLPRRVILDQARLAPGAVFPLGAAELQALQESATRRYLTTLEVSDAAGQRPYRALLLLGSYSSAAPLDTLGGFSSGAVFIVATDLSATLGTLDNLRSILFVLGLLGVGIGGAAAYWLVGQALSPLRRVQRAAENISGQSLGLRVPVPETRDEVQALAASINEMLSRLETSFELQRRFTSDASHELRTPVTAISGHAGYLLRRTALEDSQRESIEIIRRESERLSGLITSLLELARSDGGALQLRREPVLTLPFLQDIAREFAPIAQAQGAAVLVGGEDLILEADADRLTQVMLNVVHNALKAGSTEVRLSSRALDGAEGGEVEFTVRDDGPGIPAEHLGNLFERFYRVEESRSRDAGGSGLGLAIVKGIVEAHGGHIELHSVVGQGTTVTIRLPRGELPGPDDDVA